MSDQATTAERQSGPQGDGPAILEARKVTRSFGGLVAVHGVHQIGLDLLSPAEAMDLLHRLILARFGLGMDDLRGL